MLRDSALALLLLAGASYWLGGMNLLGGTVATGLFALANLAVLAWLARRITTALASGHHRLAGGAAAVLGVKSLVSLGIVALFLAVFEPLAVLLGVSCVVIGAPLSVLLHQVLGPTPGLPQESS